MQAKHDITLNSATERESRYLDESSQKKGFLSKKSSHTVQDDRVTREKGTLISGNSVTIDAGNDLTVSGSAIAADQNVDLQAGNNVDISAATETGYHYLLEEKKKSGLMGSGGIGFTVGKQSTRHEVNEDEIVQSQSFSTIGSSQGNVNITAGNKLHIGGADLIAGKDLNLSGDSVDIDSGFDRNNRTETFESKQSGFTLALSGTVGSALNTAVSVAQQARKEGDGRLRALQGTKAALSGAQAAAAYENDSALTEAANAKNAAAGIDPKADNAAQGAKNTVGITLSYGSQSSKSESYSQSSQAQGSTLNAGRNIAITATGKNKGEQSGDITLAGTQMKAGGEMTLDAARDINLLSSQNTQQTDNKNSSKGGSVGIGIGVGSGGYGITVSASVNSSKGRENGNSLTHNETTLDAGGGINLKSGRDTTLKGAQVNGETIKADVGRNLTLASEQDSDRYDSKQQSASAGGSFTFGSMTGSANVNVSKDKIHSNFDSVKEQTGLFAGKGGYQITVGNHTQLDGAVIASTADKDRNVLDTGTLGWRDIQNQADYKSEHQSAGFNSGGPIGSNLLSNVSALPISAAGGSGHAEGSTKAAVSDGNIIIRNRDAQQQDLSGLSRDTEHANDGSISPIFDKEKEQRRLQQAQLVNDVATQALDVYNTHEAARATRAATASLADTDTRTALEAQASAMLDKAHEKDPNVDNSRQAVVSKAWQLAYDQAIVRQGADMGGSVRTGVNAVVNALQALAGGDIRAALAQGAAPYLAAKVKELTTGNAPYGELTDTQKLNNLMAHALLGGVVAELSGGSAAAGATGAVTGELATPAIALALYGTADSDKLSPDQKANLSALATLASGIAAGVSSGSTAGAATGALAGKNAVENNFLGDKDITTFTEKYANAKTDADREQLLADLKKLDVEQQTKALATGIPVNEQKAELEKLKALAASPDCNAQCQQLVAYSLSELEPVANNTELHKNNLNKAILAGVIFGLTVEKPAANNPISHLTREQQQLIKNAEYITTAKGIQNPFPRDLNEKIVWNQVRANPASAGEPLKGMNKDLRFPTYAGFQKMEAKQKLSDGSTITVHYQYNSYTGKAYDMKITTPQRSVADPAKVFDSIKDVVK